MPTFAGHSEPGLKLLRPNPVRGGILVDPAESLRLDYAMDDERLNLVQDRTPTYGRNLSKRFCKWETVKRQTDLATRVPASDSCHLLVRAGSVKVVFACPFTRQFDGCGCPAVTDGLDGF